MEQARILVADDEEGIRELLREQLNAAGYITDEATDGAEAIEKLDQGTYDLAILDINMPKKSGLDVLKHIRDRKLTMGVIMLTGRLGFSVGSESMLLGADEYITKPFDLEYLELTIKKVLEGGAK
ncbi:Alkaline phosphatase synthesis transcriptional regulatory protein PhoP [Anaerolineae bacterium]|nr:Alkaline phosphatase synthesis transcriptional regulatory protein PhoP [Anaerolineae bacterium]